MRLPCPADPGSHQRPGLRQGVAAVYPGDGRWRDGSRLVVERSAALSGAAVASGADGLKQDAGR